MIDIVLVFDDEDPKMGQFNRACNEDYNIFLSKNYIAKSVNCINGNRINDIYIEAKTKTLKSFAFAGYSHGNRNCLCCKDIDYISTTINDNNFNNCFFYTVSCKAGSELANHLVSKGCNCFIGYKSDYSWWNGYPYFSECANYGFFLFLQGLKSEDVYIKMKEKYSEKIDETYKINPLHAATLLDNKKGLVHIGKNISKEDLKTNSLKT